MRFVIYSHIHLSLVLVFDLLLLWRPCFLAFMRETLLGADGVGSF
jgi:hypothetical protein